MKFEPKQKVGGRYEIIEKIGEGGMGIVWKAIDVRLGDKVVIKVPQFIADSEILKRFSKEAQAMRKHSLDCPNILEINDVGMCGDHPYYVMRFLPGGNLRQKTLEQDTQANSVWNVESFDWLAQIASALDYLHDQGTVHRDVKPDNILFSDSGMPYLVDFGVAKTTSETQSVITETGKVVGTWAYMAPELLDDKPFLPQADQYALAVALYETVTGERPFGGTTPVAIVKSIINRHRSLKELSGSIPKPASDAVDRALALEPESRFASCTDFANEFLNGLKNTLPQTLPPSEQPTGLVPIGQYGDEEIQDSEKVKGGKEVDPELIEPIPVQGGAQPPTKPNTQRTNQSLFVFAYPLATLVAIAIVGGIGWFAFERLNGPESQAKIFERAEVSLLNSEGSLEQANAAVKSFEQLAGQGHLLAQKRLVEIYFEGQNGIELDVQEAFSWNLKAASQNDAQSQLLVGLSYAGLRKGTEPDDLEARRWMRKAAEQGLTEAQESLGELLFQDGRGQIADFAEAQTWFTRAVDSGSQSAIQNLKSVKAARYRHVAEKQPEDVVNEIDMRLRRISAAGFEMGSPGGELGRFENEVLHPVAIDEYFYIGACEVTRSQWRSVMNTTPWRERWGTGKSGVTQGNCPATYITHAAAQEFCKQLSKQTGDVYRLPTEQEWEYACRGNSSTSYSFGDSTTELTNYAWYLDNSTSDVAQPVGQKKANSFGLFDMHGNVWEWCSNPYVEDLKAADNGQTSQPTGRLVIRGGSWYSDAASGRSAMRLDVSEDTENFEIGFRVIREIKL